MNMFYLIVSFILFCFSGFSGECYRGELLEEKLTQESLKPLDNRCRIILLRHGETDWNTQGKKQGWTDIPLNEEGERQAQNLAEKLSDLTVKTIYSSSLSRATKTAEIIAARHKGVSVIPDPALRFYRLDKIKLFNIFKTKKMKKDQMTREVTEDSIAYFKKLSLKHPGETVLVVTHSRVVKSVIRALEDRKTREIRIKNMAIVRVIGDGETLSIEW